MKMSTEAYIIANCLLTSAFTLHDLLATLVHVEKVPADVVDHRLHSGLRELVQRGWAQWEYEPDYGNAPSIRPTTYSVASFEDDWARCTSVGKLRQGVPDKKNPTMLFEATDELAVEMTKTEYHVSKFKR